MSPGQISAPWAKPSAPSRRSLARWRRVQPGSESAARAADSEMPKTAASVNSVEWSKSSSGIAQKAQAMASGGPCIDGSW